MRQSRTFIAISAMTALLAGCSSTGSNYDTQASAASGSEATFAESSQVVAPYIDTAEVNDTFYFNFDSESIDAEAHEVLAEYANYLKSHANTQVAITGHTDKSFTGRDAYNNKLSLRRAETVASHLRSLGVNESQIEVSGFGSDKPAYPDSQESPQAKNRRVELRFEMETQAII